MFEEDAIINRINRIRSTLYGRWQVFGHNFMEAAGRVLSLSSVVRWPFSVHWRSIVWRGRSKLQGGAQP
jgi:hypothetical protein